jgi:nicotinamide/nicotinate riboside kinase
MSGINTSDQVAGEHSTLIVAVSGPSCSGKTTLSKLLLSIFSESATLLHQDDFYLSDSEIPSKTLPDGRTVADWDCAASLDIDRLAETLKAFRRTGSIDGVKSIQGQQPEGSKLAIDLENMKKLKDVAQSAVKSLGVPINILFVDGFLLYGIGVLQLMSLFDVKLFLPLSYELVKARREARAGYVTLDGYWADPEGYVDEVVWPNYESEHAFLFTDRDVRAGKTDEQIVKELGIVACEGEDLKNIEKPIEWAVREITDALHRLAGLKVA